MKQIKLLIGDRDIEYSTALGKALINRFPIFKVVVKDGKYCKKEDVINGNLCEIYDIILLHEELKSRLNSSNKDIQKFVGLCEENTDVCEKEGFIYKYSGAAEISAHIQFIYARNSGKNNFINSKTQTIIIGFTGAAGGTGKTSAALSVARELAFSHKYKVLYLSMEEVESTEIYMYDRGGRGTISDYIYYLLSDREGHFATYIDNFIITDEYGLDAFRPSKGINETGKLPPDKLLLLFDSISKNGYRYICLDFTADCSAQTVNLLKKCSIILLIDDPNPLSQYKNQRLLKYINSYYGVDFSQQIITVRNKWAAGNELPSSDTIVVDYDAESFRIRDKYIEININRGYGLGVKKIAEEIRRKI